MWWIARTWAAPSAEELESDWEKWRAQLDASAEYPLRFADDEWEKIAAGQVARRRERLDGTDRVLAVRWLSSDIDTTWLAMYDPHGAEIHSFLEEELPGSTFDRRVVYQRIDLPWPMAARQWVVEVRNNLPLIDATGGAVWERTWTLSDRRGARAESPDGVWLPVNEGGWFLAESGGGTLLGYHVRTVVGGVVPDEAAVQWSYATLSSLLNGIADRVPGAVGHYRAGHSPVRRPDGTAIPTR
ncbi:MAG: hypothetical protein ABMA64_05410 [Myxococcota bacterium]